MIRKFFKEMPKDEKPINAVCLGLSLFDAVIFAVAAWSCGASIAVSLAIGLSVVLLICGYRFSLLWILFKDSLDGSPRRSTNDYIITGLTGC